MIRISKLVLPHPMPSAFAHQLAQLVVGLDASPSVQALATSKILLAAWESRKPLTLIELYRNQDVNNCGEIDLALFESIAVRRPHDEVLYEEAVAQIEQMVHILNQEKAESFEGSLLNTEIREQWATAIYRFNGTVKVSTQVRNLVNKYKENPESPMPDGNPEDLSGSSNVGKGLVVWDFSNLSQNAKLKASGAGIVLKGAASSSAKSETGTVVDYKKPYVQIFAPSCVKAILNRMPVSNHPLEGNAQQRTLLQSLADDSGLRQLHEVPAGDPLAEMYQRFPHFGEVLDLVSSSLALAGCGDDGRPVYIPPILLRGTAGTGKTYFAQELARVLQLHFVERDLSVTSEAFVLVGMDASWKNSKAGIVFDALVHARSANPLILLDELDKVATSTSHNSPMQALHALLEPTSAATFTDEYIPVKLDASHVNWILTANQAYIPDPILTRLEVFDIREPTRQECRQIAASVWARLCATKLPRGHGFALELPDDILDYMSQCTPRVMRKMLTLAAGRAVQDSRRSIVVTDLTTAAKRYVVPEKTMGFV